ncbi:DUF948 domain-containing protein [Shouchella shacheensis]|uniref:DUF948 domain-containing protein n=1 Tax=Shouchella shacheensis TaxID=1649580 RepID=UPI00074001C8|nr:DUF948 domain-containing protein [Shouchella shacheensis]
MDWLGIGVFILSLGFIAGVIFLIPVFKKLTETLNNTARTVSQVEKSLDDLTGETKVVLHNANETLMDVNQKVAKLDPIFAIIEDSGQAAHNATATVAKYTATRRDLAKKEAAVVTPQNVQGVFKGAAFLYYLRKAKKAQKKNNVKKE